MASRGLLHLTRLDEFLRYCHCRDVETRPGRGDWQVAQVFVDGNWHVLYERARMPEHLTVPRPLLPLVNEFMDAKRAVGL